MEPPLERRVRDRRVIRRRRRDVHEIQRARLRLQKLAISFIDPHTRELLPRLLAPGFADIRDRDERDVARARGALEIRRHVPARRDETVADDRAPKR